MNHLAPLIRKGKNTGGVVEDRNARDIVRHRAGSTTIYYANIAGLALIGKLGKERAAELFLLVQNELHRSMTEGKATAELCRELDTTMESLNILNKKHTLGLSAIAIAEHLETEAAVRGLI